MSVMQVRRWTSNQLSNTKSPVRGGFVRKFPLRSWRKRLLVGPVTVTLALSWASFVFAEMSEPKPTHSGHPEESEQVVYLSFEQALRRGGSIGPEVALARASSEALKEAVRESNPIFTQLPVLQTQLGPRFTGGQIKPDIIVSLSQPIALTRKGAIQEQLARAEQDVGKKGVQWSALQGAEQAGQAWIELALSEELLEIRKHSVEQAKLNLKLVESRVRVGESDQAERALAQSEVASAQSLVLDAEGRHFEAASLLAFLTSLPGEKRAEVRARLSRPVETSAVEGEGGRGSSEASSRVESHPYVQMAEAEAKVSKASIAYTKTQQAPMMAVGVQYQREGTGDHIITGVLTLPLPIGTPWSYQQARKRARYDQDKARAELVKRRQRQELIQARHERLHARAQYDLLLASLLPPKEEAVRLAQIKFKAGESNFMRLTIAQRELLAARERLACALADVYRAQLRYEQSSGTLGIELEQKEMR